METVTVDKSTSTTQTTPKGVVSTTIVTEKVEITSDHDIINRDQFAGVTIEGAPVVPSPVQIALSPTSDAATTEEVIVILNGPESQIIETDGIEGQSFQENLSDAFQAIVDNLDKASATNLLEAYRIVAPDGVKVPKKFGSVSEGKKKLLSELEKLDGIYLADAVITLLGNLSITFPAEQLADLKQQKRFESDRLKAMTAEQIAAEKPKVEAKGPPAAKTPIDALVGGTPQTLYPPITPVTTTSVMPKTRAAPAAKTAADGTKVKSDTEVRVEKLMVALNTAGEKGLHIDELAKKMDTSNLFVRNAIDAARRQKISVLALGKGVFRKG